MHACTIQYYYYSKQLRWNPTIRTLLNGGSFKFICSSRGATEYMQIQKSCNHMHAVIVNELESINYRDHIYLLRSG